MKKRRTSDKPSYGLKQVRTLIDNGNVEIDDTALTCANFCFGWRVEDILKAVSMLKPMDFHKTSKHYTIPDVYEDYYRAKRIMNERVYIHFHITAGFLVIGECKEDGVQKCI